MIAAPAHRQRLLRFYIGEVNPRINRDEEQDDWKHNRQKTADAGDSEPSLPDVLADAVTGRIAGRECLAE